MYVYIYNCDSKVALEVKNLPANAGDIKDKSLISGSGRAPGGGHGTHSSTLAWKIPWTKEPGQSHGQRSMVRCMLVYKGVTFMYSRDWHNIVNQLYVD